jgi:nucleoid DNA-binding protein
MKKIPITKKKTIKKQKAQRVSVLEPEIIITDEAYRPFAQILVDDFGIQVTGTMSTDGFYAEQNLVSDTIKLDAFRDGLYYYLDTDGYMQSQQRNEMTGELLPIPADWSGPFANVWCDAYPQEEDGYYRFGISNPACEAGASACLIKMEGEEYLFKRAPEPEPESEYRTLPQLFLEDFGIQISEGEWAEGDCREDLPVIDAAKLNSFENNLCYAEDSNPVTGLERGSVESGDNYCFVIYNPATVDGVNAAVYFEVLLTKSEAGYLFKRAGVEDNPDDSVPSEEGYRTLADLFLDDFGIQLTKTEGEWTNGEWHEWLPVIDTNKLQVLPVTNYSQQTDLFFIDDNSGAVTGVQFDSVTEAGLYHFLIYNPRADIWADILLIKSTTDYSFKRSEPEYIPEPEPKPAPSEPEPPAPEPIPPPTPEPTPEPVVVIPAKSALEEVYTTLTAQKLCTIVGLRTLLAKEQGISIKEAKSRITAVFKAVSDISALSGKSALYGLGVFRQQKVKARTVVSHLGFGTYKLPRSSKFVFKPGKILKAKMAMCTGKTTAQIITTLQNLDTIKAAKSTVRKATRKKAIKKSGTSGK